jgi:hypothetical protein
MRGGYCTSAYVVSYEIVEFLQLKFSHGIYTDEH